MRQKGIVIFWNRQYGFIEKEDKQSIFFHKSQVKDVGIRMLMEVSFVEGVSSRPRHQGKPVADDVRLERNEPLINDFDRYVGVIDKIYRNGTGKITSIQLERSTLFSFARRLYVSDRFSEGDTVIFSPIKSNKDPNDYFALFLYKIENEDNLPFLIEKQKENPTKAVSDRVDQLLKSNHGETLSINDIFYIKLSEIGYINNAEAYHQLTKLINKFAKQGYTPDFKLLKESCEQRYLIQLFENGIIKEYDYDIIQNYFHTAPANSKRFIAASVSVEDRLKVLENHFQVLENSARLKRLNHHLKTLLDIIFRNPHTKEPKLYKRVVSYINVSLSTRELFDLWINGYLDSLAEDKIKELITPEYILLIRPMMARSDANQTNKIRRVVEDYLLQYNIANYEDFLNNYLFNLILYYNLFDKDYSTIKESINNRLTDKQRFTALVHGVELPSDDALKFIHSNPEEIDVYHKIKYLLYKSKNKQEVDKELISQITPEVISEYINSNPWNDSIQPIWLRSEDTFGNDFLKVLEEFNKEFELTLPIKDIADSIFDSIALYTVHHLRLWLYNYVDDSRYDYYEYRKSFNELTKEEQKEFKKKADTIRKQEAVESEKEQVKPCRKYTTENDGSRLYTAKLENIFFRKNYLQLRLSDGEYSEEFGDDDAGPHLNQIASDAQLNQIDIFIRTEGNKITKVIGLEKVTQYIHSSTIAKSLGTTVKVLSTSEDASQVSYNEDWALIQKTNEYLHARQDPEFEVKYVAEPVINIRSNKENETVASDQTALYIVKVDEYSDADDYAIIWNSIDHAPSKAIYIFKTLRKNVEQQLDKIIELITTRTNLRSTLNKNSDEAMLQIFKDNVGYVANIRKRRGVKESYKDITSKLEEILLLPVPTIPSAQHLKMLESWSPENKKTVTAPLPITRRVVKISDSQIREMDDDVIASEYGIKRDKPKSSQSKPDDKQQIQEQHYILYKSLKELNELIYSTF